jgi:hypothetical protein
VNDRIGVLSERNHLKRGKGGNVVQKEDEEDRVYRKEEKEDHSQTRQRPTDY